MFLLPLLLACNACNDVEQCDGDTLLVCGASVDQLYNRQVNEVPCEGAAPATCDGGAGLRHGGLRHGGVSGAGTGVGG